MVYRIVKQEVWIAPYILEPASRPMTNPRRSIVSEIDVSSAPFIAGPPSSSGFLTLVDQILSRLLKKKDAFADDTPSAKASEVSDTPSETPEAGRGYEPPVSSDDYLRGSLLLPFSMGDLRNNPMGCLGGKIFTLSHSLCQAQTPLLPRAIQGQVRALNPFRSAAQKPTP